ncbi:hypothetical protein EfmE1679_0204 [Enterococcus faecium E1679]|nr:hypothetical protein EfmE1679_0204 [Enterococcus faecium E1679]
MLFSSFKLKNVLKYFRILGRLIYAVPPKLQQSIIIASQVS